MCLGFLFKLSRKAVCLLDNIEVINDNKAIPSVTMETDFISDQQGSTELTWIKIDMLKSSKTLNF